MQRGQNSRTAGAVSYGVGFFGLVNIMQPQNCTTRLRRLVWTSFFLCVVFLFHFVWFFFFYDFPSCWGCWSKEECIFSVAFKYNKTFFVCVKCTFLDDDLFFVFFLQVFILTFVQTSLQEDILWYYIVRLFDNRPTCRVWRGIFGHMSCEAEEANMWPRHYWSQIAQNRRIKARLQVFYMLF